MKISFRVVRSIDDPESTERYISGHFDVLMAYGVTKVTSADRSWTKNPNVYLLLVESQEDGRMLGGGRVQLRTTEFPLPLESAIYEKDKNIVIHMEKYSDLEVAEYCGLWNSKEVSGYGIGSIFLIRLGVALTYFLNLKCLMAFCSPFTVRNSQAVGLHIIECLGDKGTFLYPKEGLIATIMEVNDVQDLSKADEEERDFIFDLRNNPKQTKKFTNKLGELEVEFDLNLIMI
jgi:hypothetical protein